MSRFRSMASAFALAAAACLLAGINAFRTATTFVMVHTYEVARDFIFSAVASFERPRLALLQRPVELVQACAYALRIAKRERPQVRATWRMCPST